MTFTGIQMKMVFMTIWARVIRLMLGLIAVVALVGCTATSADSAHRAGRLSIVTAFYPLQFVTERVAGAHADVINLTKPGAEPHDLELTPRQVASVGDADLVVYERSFQAAVDEAVAQSGNTQVLDTTTVVPLQDHGPLGQDRNTAPPGGRRDANLDPHVWLDPHNMITIARAVAGRLERIDPAHAADYRHNLTRLTDQLTTVDDSYRTGLQQCARRRFVTTHAAFGYLAERYGLTQIAVAGLSPDIEPSPARIAEVQQQIARYHVTTIFSEPLASAAVARSIAGDLGLRADVLDPLEGITAQSRGTDYLAVMRSNLTALEQANGCNSHEN